MAKLDVDMENASQRLQGSLQRHLHKKVLEEAHIPLPMLLLDPGTAHSPHCASAGVYEQQIGLGKNNSPEQ